MSNTFDFNRFKKVFVRDFHATYSRFGLVILIIVIIPLVFWLLSLDLYSPNEYSYHNFYLSPVDRLMRLLGGVLLTVAIAPGIIYKSCNVKGRGNYFALLPASISEKYFSMLLYCCVVVPAVIIVGTLVLDTVLTVLPFVPYHDFIWQYGSYDSYFGSIVWYNIVYLFLVASIFMFANTIFKRAKFVKTVLWLY